MKVVTKTKTDNERVSLAEDNDSSKCGGMKITNAPEVPGTLSSTE